MLIQRPRKGRYSPRQHRFLASPAFDLLGTGPIALDLETTGLSPLEDSIVLIGLSGEDETHVYDVRSWDDDDWDDLFTVLQDQGTIYYNSVFDYAFLYEKNGRQHLDGMIGDGLILFRMLANEGWPGQDHRLETAMRDVLGWPVSSKNEMKEALEKHKLTKGDMWQLADLEPDLFAKYCAADADAHRQVWFRLLEIAEKWPAVEQFITQEWVISVLFLVEQYFDGLRIDRELLSRELPTVIRKKQAAKNEIISHPSCKDWIESYQKQRGLTMFPPLYSIKIHWAKKTDNPWEGGDWEFTTVPTKNKWEEEFGGRFFRREVRITASARNLKNFKWFNLSSTQDLQALLYDHLSPGYEISERQVELWEGKIITEKFVRLPSGIEVDLTKGDGLPTGRDVLHLFGEVGLLLKKYMKYEKLEQFYNVYLNASEKDGHLHPQFKPAGASITGRNSGGEPSGGASSARKKRAAKFSLQQIPKDETILRAMIPEDGCAFYEADVASLEPTVQANFCDDPTLNELYLSGRKHDIYLFFGKTMHPDPEVRAMLQERYAPENFEELKKDEKVQRNKILKPQVLGCAYGLGHRKFQKQMAINGIALTEEQCREGIRGYWDAQPGLSAFRKDLMEERKKNGFLVNGFGLPHAKKGDELNSFSQATGHYCLLVWLFHIWAVREETGAADWFRPRISDLHDEVIFHGPLEKKEEATYILTEALRRTNEQMGGIPLKAEVEVAESFWDFKGG